jgi:two-component system, chemotaxis family, CheB/CheR fusion protein
MEDPAGAMPVTGLGSRRQLIIVVCPTASVETAVRLISAIPGNFPAPIAVAPDIHSAPEGIADLIRSRSAFSVRSVRDRSELRPGMVYVVAGETTAEIDGDQIRSTARRSRRSGNVGHLIASAADSFGSGLIVVILPDTDAPTAALLRQVRAAGGTILLATDSEDQARRTLPLIPTTVDVSGDLTQIARALEGLVSVPEERPAIEPNVAGATPEERLVAELAGRLAQRTQIDSADYWRIHVMRQLWRGAAAQMGLTERINLVEQVSLVEQVGLPRYTRQVATDPDEQTRIVGALGQVEGFFSRPESIEYLKKELLPAVLESARSRGSALRIWTPECATGEDTYAIAILLAELLGDTSELQVRILATDRDDDAVRFARRGVYPAGASSQLTLERLKRNFVQLNGTQQIHPAIRRMIVFGQHDLCQQAPFPQIDLLLGRDSLSGLPAELQSRTLELFAFSVRTGGYFLLDPAEVLPKKYDDLFSLQRAEPRVYQRFGDKTTVPPVRVVVPLAPTSSRGSDASNVPRDSRPSLGPVDRPDRVLEQLPIGVVTVDAHYHITGINTAARRLLGIHTATVGDDLVHLTGRIPPSELRHAIDSALSGTSTGWLYEAALAERGADRDIHLTCTLELREPGRPPGVAVAVADVTDLVRQRNETRAALDQQRAASEAITEARETTQQRYSVLDEANQQLSRMNLELLGANQELSVEREEALTATEEVQTLNEELRATNEELEALNEEQRITLAELHEANAKLEVRTLELQELSQSLDAQRQASDEERARLSALLLSVGDPIVVVDETGAPLLANPAYDRTFGRGANAFLALDESGRLLPSEEHPLHRAARGESFTMEFTTVAPDGQRRHCEATGEPVSAAGADRGVVVLRDVTERSIYRVQDEFLALASHELRTPLSAILVYLELLEQRSQPGAPPADLHRFAERALHQAYRLKDLTGDLLDATRLQHGKLALRTRDVNLCEIAQQAIEGAQALPDAPPIRLECSEERIDLHGDPSRLEQVILNLLTNAVAHAPGTEEIRVNLSRADWWAVLAVEDLGEGIPQSEIPFLFDRFRQFLGERQRGSSGQGLGLGLYIAKEIVTAHGGEISVESQLGRGARFTVRLPLLPGN